MVNSVSTLLMDVRAASDINELIGIEHPHSDNSRPKEEPLSVTDISLSGIRYGYSPGAKILDGLDFEFQSGKTIAIIGPSGSGKSTLADMLLGLIRPESGTVRIN